MQSFSVPHSKLDSHIYIDTHTHYHLRLLCLWQVSNLLLVIALLQEFLFFPLSHQKDDGRFYTLPLMTVLSWCPFTLISFPFWENSSWFYWIMRSFAECWVRSIFYIFTCIRFQIKFYLTSQNVSWSLPSIYAFSSSFFFNSMRCPDQLASQNNFLTH